MYSGAENEVKNVCDFAQDVLFAVEHSMHYEKLSKHIFHSYATSKTFFHYYTKTERFSFFKKYPNFFLADNDGNISSIETQIIHTFNELIKASGVVHFLKLVKAVEKSSSYFNGWTESEKFYFFRGHSHLFNIRGDGYVSVKSTQSITYVCGDNGEILKSFFKKCLETLGPMYFTWLYEHFEKSPLIPNDFHKGMSYDKLWNFFKVHDSVFVISEDGFVTLASCQSRKVVKFLIPKSDNELLIGFFVTKLMMYRSILYTLLLKFLQESTLEVKGFFAGCSLGDVLDYFVQNSDIFVVNNNKYVLLRNNGSDTSPFFSLGGHQLFHEQKQQAVDFFLNCLKTTKPIHFTNLSKTYETSDIHTDFKFAFTQCSVSEKFRFFKNIEFPFAMGNDGYVSLPTMYEDSHITRHVAWYFVKQLKEFHSISFCTLINSLESSSPSLKEYFSDSPLFSKYYFFKKYFEIFSMNTDGVVSLTENYVDVNQCKHIMTLMSHVMLEKDVIKMLVNQLRTFKQVHFLKLCSCEDVRVDMIEKFFQLYSDVQKRNFFLQWRYYFHIDNDYVSLPSQNEMLCDYIPVPKSESFNIQNENDSTCNSSAANNVSVSGDIQGLESRNDDSTVSWKGAVFSYKSKACKKSKIIEILINQLNASSPIHFEKLTSKFNNNKAVLEFFQTYSVSEKHWFFIDHSEYFEVKAGYVYLKKKAKNKKYASNIKQNHTPVIESNKKSTGKQLPVKVTSSSCQTDKIVEIEDLESNIVKVLRDQLNDTEHVHFLKLCKSAECQNEVVKSFFSTFTVSDKYKFFRTHSGIFCVGTDGYVCLSDTMNRGAITKKSQGVNVSECSRSNGRVQTDENAATSKNVQARNIISNATSIKLNTVLETKENYEANKFIFKDGHKREVIKILEDLLRTSGCLHFLKLFSAAEDQNEVVKNFFSTSSVSDKYKFLKSRSNLYHIGNDGYVRLHDTVRCRENRSTTQITKNVISSEIAKVRSERDSVIISEFQTLPETKKPCQVRKSVSTKGQEKEVIQVLTKTLQKSMCLHFLKLCNLAASQSKTVQNFFSSMSTVDKYKFVKSHSNFFHVDKDSFVRCCYIVKCQEDKMLTIKGQNIDTSEAEKFFQDDQSICIVEQKVIKVLVNLLRASGRLHFLKVCGLAECQSEDVKNFFFTFSISDKLKFLKSHLAFFQIGSDDYVCFNDTIMCQEVERFVTTEQNLNTSKLAYSNSCAQIDKNIVSPETIKVRNGVDNVTISAFPTPSETEKSDQVNKPVLTKDQEQEVIKVLVVTYRYIVDLLKPSGGLHFLKLCSSVECQSEVAKNFFSVLSDSDKYHFFKDHPDFFFIDKSSHVYLSNLVEHPKSDFPLVSVKNCTLDHSLVTDNNKLDTEKFSSPVKLEIKEIGYNNSDSCLDDISDIFTSVCDSEPLASNLEKGVIDSLIDVLKYNALIHCEELCCMSIEKAIEQYFELLFSPGIPNSFDNNLKYFNTSADHDVSHSDNHENCENDGPICSEQHKTFDTSTHKNNSVVNEAPDLENCANVFSEEMCDLNPDGHMRADMPCSNTGERLPSSNEESSENFILSSESVIKINDDMGDKNCVNVLSGEMCILSCDNNAVMQCNDEGEHISSSKEASLEDVTVPAASDVKNDDDINDSEKILIDFFQSVLCSADILHYEELTLELEDSDFAEQLLVFKQLGKVNFFKNHSDIFIIDSNGFISLKCPVIQPTNPLKEELSSEELNPLLPSRDISTRSNLEILLKLGELHISIVRYFAKALSSNQSVHYKLLVKNVCTELVAVKSFFMLFTTSADIQEFIKLHDMYFTIDSEEMVSLKQSNINCDQVLASDKDMTNVIQAIVTQAVEFYRNVLNSEHNISFNMLKDKLSSAPGYIISFFKVNYPGNDLLNFFRSHHNYFHVNENDCVSLITSEVIIEGNIMCEDNENGTTNVCIHDNSNEMTPSQPCNLTANDICVDGSKYFELQKVNCFTSHEPSYSASLSSNISSINLNGSTAANIHESKSGSISQINVDLMSVDEKFNETTSVIKSVDEKQEFKPSNNKRNELETVIVESIEQNDEKVSQCEVSKSTCNESFTNKYLLVKHPSSDEKVNNELQSETAEGNHEINCHFTSNMDIGEFVDSKFQHVEITPECKHMSPDYSNDMNKETYPKVITKGLLSPLANKTKINSCCSVSPSTEYFSTGSITSLPASSVMYGITSACTGDILNVSSASQQYLNASNSTAHAVEASSNSNAPLQNDSLTHLLTLLQYVYTEGKSANNSVSNFSGIEQSNRFSHTKILPEYSLEKQRAQAVQQEFQIIANFYDPELEELCVQFFKAILQKNAHKVVNIKFLQLCASHSDQKIKAYLSNYIKQELPLFFYLHLNHFTIDSSGYVRLRSHVEKKESNVDIECKAVNFFAVLLYGRFKDGTSCSVLQNCLYLASEEVRSYIRYKYPENLQTFFRKHSHEFLIDGTGNISLK